MDNRNNQDRGRRRPGESQDYRNRQGSGDRRQRRPQRGQGSQTSSAYDQASSGASSQRPSMRPNAYAGYGPGGERRDDERILEDIRDRLTQHAEIDANEILVAVSNGEVTLTGVVADSRIKRVVEANVVMIPGVVDVHNELLLKEEPTREEIAAKKTAEEMAEKFPGGPTPTGNAGY